MKARLSDVDVPPGEPSPSDSRARGRVRDSETSREERGLLESSTGLAGRTVGEEGDGSRNPVRSVAVPGGSEGFPAARDVTAGEPQRAPLPTLCSMCHGIHGPEVVHPCE